MWLFIDSTSPDNLRTGLIGGRGARVKKISGRSNRILPETAKFLGRDGMKKLDGVCVVQGPGSFTSVRTGVLIANLLARSSRKPLVGVDVSEAQDLAALDLALESGGLCAMEYVAPKYSAEPNITMPAKRS